MTQDEIRAQRRAAILQAVDEVLEGQMAEADGPDEDDRQVIYQFMVPIFEAAFDAAMKFPLPKDS